MKQFLVATLFVVLMAGMAVGQTQHVYVMKNVTAGRKDVTTMTNTVNAWKYAAGNPVCTSKSLTLGALDGSVWCMGANSGPPYMFDRSAKSWTGHPEMGTSPVQLIVIDQSHLYSLQPTATCGFNYGGSGKQSYDLFKWNGSAWTQPHPGSCIFQASADRQGNLVVIGWDGTNHITAIFKSTDGGQSFQFWSDSWKFAQMTTPDYGCAVTNAGSVWRINTSGSPMSYPAIPSGTVAGCLIAERPAVTMAWTTTGIVYSMPLENWNTWQRVTGISAQIIVGSQRFWLWGEDSAGKPYHWNVNAPSISATFGGQWNPSLGCPNSNSPCGTGAPGFPVPTHTVSGRVYFTSGHGIDGVKRVSTQTYTNDIEVNPQDTNPLCDPFVGPANDSDCGIASEGDGLCNQSMQPVGSDSFQVLGVFESVDDSSWINNDPAQSNQVPYILAGVAGVDGIWAADSWNYITGACPLTSAKIPGTCPLQSPEHSGFTQAFEGQGASDVVYADVLGRLSAANQGIDSPYVYYDAYMEIQMSSGFTFNQCLGTPNEDNEPYKFLWTAWVLLPECK